jgi:hypothetical protein
MNGYLTAAEHIAPALVEANQMERFLPTLMPIVLTLLKSSEIVAHRMLPCSFVASNHGFQQIHR